jgi:predicted ATPase
VNILATDEPLPPMEIIVITGMSGSGKSVALRALEDAGLYCVDNLPPELLASFIELEKQHKVRRVAIAIDVRSANKASTSKLFFSMPIPKPWCTVFLRRAAIIRSQAAKAMINAAL